MSLQSIPTRIWHALGAPKTRIGSAALIAVVCLAGWWFHDRTRTRVYRIGHDYAPPALLLDARQRPRGPLVEVVERAADAVGVRLEWVYAPEGPEAALTSRKVDLWPILAQLESRKGRIHVSEPYLRLTFWLFTREGRVVPEDWSRWRVAAGPNTVPLFHSSPTLPPVQLLPLESQAAAVDAVCRGAYDAAVLMEGVGDAIVLRKPPACGDQRMALHALHGSVIWFGVGAVSRDFGAIQAADRLRDEIGTMTRDGRFSTIAFNWGLVTSGQASTVYDFTAAARSERRMRIALAGMCLAVVVLIWHRRKLRQAREAADRANRAKSAFLANMSHEVRTPMTGVLGMAELMLQSTSPAEQREFALTIHQSAEALLEVINDILDLARIEAGRIPLRPAPFSAAALLVDIGRLFQARALEKGIELRTEVAAGAPLAVTGDATRIRQILANLAGNAVKFTDKGSVTLRLDAVCTAGRAALRYTVADTGIGIAADRLPELFRTFSQIENGRSPIGSSGLGLAISRRLAELMGGDVTVVSAPGRGSTFVFEVQLPLAAALPDPVAEPVRPSPLARPRHVLVVEDNPVNRRLVEAMLKRLGCTADLAADGEQALSLAVARHYDLVLMDWHMPGYDGLETTRRLQRQWTAEQRAPVVALTASVMEGDREACLSAGMVDYVTKPIQLARLAEVLQSWSAQPGPAEPRTQPGPISPRQTHQ